MNRKGFTEWLKSPMEGIGWKKVLRLAEVMLILALVIYLAPIALNLFFGWKIYGYFFEKFAAYGVPGYLSGILAVWFVAMILWFGPAIAISLLKHRKDWIWKSAIIISVCLGVIYAISYPYSNSLFNPFTGQPNFRYSKNNDGVIEKFPRAFTVNPKTGLPLKDFNPRTAEEFLNPGPSLKDIISGKEIKINNLNQKLDSTKKEIKNFEQKLSLARAKIKEKEDGISKNKIKVNDLEEELELSNNRISAQISVIDGLKKGLESANREIERRDEIAESQRKQSANRPEKRVEPKKGEQIVVPTYSITIGDAESWSGNSFRITISSIKKEGDSRIRFDLLIKYLRTSGTGYLGLWKPKNNAELTDDIGNHHEFKGENNFSGFFPANVNVSSSLVFLSPPPEAETVNLTFKCEINSRVYTAIFRSINLKSVEINN
jgi:hypothetical protein